MEPPKTDIALSSALPESAPSSPNPWKDDSPEDSTEKLKASAPEPLSQSIVTAISPEKDIIVENSVEIPVSKDVLSEFDPLADAEEKESRDAWASSESHPPPPRTPSPPPEPPAKDDHPAASAISPASSASFASLAALARSFSIPLARSRPVSMDMAKPVPSPSTMSSFVSQQQRPHTSPSTPTKASLPLTDDTEDSEAGKDNDEIPFDFQKFLDQMKSRSAEPVAKYLKSFLSNFAKRSFTVNDQIKIINDFLTFISKQMRECDVWANASDIEFDNAMEGMEKLVMNQLYQFTFTPQVLLAIPPRQITADDIERDRVLSQRTALFGWIEEKHLDVPEGEGSKGFLLFAQQELLKINHYKAPRDKLICILNTCKVIFGLIRHLHKEEGADSFVPILIYVVLKANPEHLLSNVEFINRFRNPEKLQSEAGYYLSSLMGAVSFIETMDHTSLSSITQEEFERNVEEAIQGLPSSEVNSPTVSNAAASFHPHTPTPTPTTSHVGEESAQPLSLPTPAQTFSDDAKRLLQKTGDTISKPLNAISRIFNEALDGAENKLTYLPGPFAPLELGREQRAAQGAPPVPHWTYPGEAGHGHAGPPAPLNLQTPANRHPDGLPQIHTPYKPRVRRAPSSSHHPNFPDSPGYNPEDTPSRSGPFTNQPLAHGPSQAFYGGHLPVISPRVNALTGDGGDSAHVSRTPTPNLDMAGIQAQITRAHEQEVVAARETLLQIFPTVDQEIVGWVLEANEGDLGRSIEALLEMSTAD